MWRIKGTVFDQRRSHMSHLLMMEDAVNDIIPLRMKVPIIPIRIERRTYFASNVEVIKPLGEPVLDEPKDMRKSFIEKLMDRLKTKGTDDLEIDLADALVKKLSAFSLVVTIGPDRPLAKVLMDNMMNGGTFETLFEDTVYYRCAVDKWSVNDNDETYQIIFEHHQKVGVDDALERPYC